MLFLVKHYMKIGQNLGTILSHFDFSDMVHMHMCLFAYAQASIPSFKTIIINFHLYFSTVDFSSVLM